MKVSSATSSGNCLLCRQQNPASKILCRHVRTRDDVETTSEHAHKIAVARAMRTLLLRAAAGSSTATEVRPPPPPRSTYDGGRYT